MDAALVYALMALAGLLYAGLVYWLREMDPDHGLTAWLVVTGDAVIHQSPGTGVQVISPLNGDLSERIIGAFLDATPVDFREPSTLEHLSYHRTISAGGAVVNIPPHVDATPAPPPRAPLTWPDYLALRVGAELACAIGDRDSTPSAAWPCIQQLADLTLN